MATLNSLLFEPVLVSSSVKYAWSKSEWSFQPNVTDVFAETSVDPLKVIALSCYSSVKVVVLSEESGDFSIIQLGLFCLTDVLGGYCIPVKNGKGASLGLLV